MRNNILEVKAGKWELDCDYPGFYLSNIEDIIYSFFATLSFEEINFTLLKRF